MEGFIQRTNVRSLFSVPLPYSSLLSPQSGGFIILHTQDVAKELELSRDGCREQRAGGSKVVNSLI